MNKKEIHNRLLDLGSYRYPYLVGQTYLKRGTSFSKPIWMECDDGNVYVIKGRHAGRSIFNDQVIARIGKAMNAPVSVPQLVEIPEELQQAEPQLADISPGISHGTLNIDNTTDREWISHHDKPYNRSRFASLAILYGWLYAGDQQLIYSNQDPFLVYSVDHGHFFPGGPDWRIDTLNSQSPSDPHQDIMGSCNISKEELQVSLKHLSNISEVSIVDIIAIPPDEWGVTIEERVEISAFIIARRREMLARFLG